MIALILISSTRYKITFIFYLFRFTLGKIITVVWHVSSTIIDMKQIEKVSFQDDKIIFLSTHHETLPTTGCPSPRGRAQYKYLHKQEIDMYLIEMG